MTELVHVTRGIWRPAAQIESLAGRVAAFLQACPDDTVVAGLTPAKLHGLWLPDLPDAPIEVIVHPVQPDPHERSHNRRPGLRARRQAVAPDEVTMLDGLPILTEARTWFGLADRLSLPDLVAAGDSALRGSASPDELQIVLKRALHRRGVVKARAVLPYLDARSRSRPESHLRYGLVSSGLPKPAVNEPIHDEHGEWLFEPDLSYDDVKLALEYNGSGHAAVKHMRRDITRLVDVGRRGGWRTEVFGPTEVFGRIDQVVSYVRQLRRERLAQFR